MSHRSILTKKSPINQFLFKLGFFLYFSKPVLTHIEQFIKGSIQKGYKGTVTDIVLLSLANCHRTTFGKFLSEGVGNKFSSFSFKIQTSLGTSITYYYAFQWQKVLPYSIERYKKGEKSKIEMVCEIVAELPSPKGKAYGLCDSWFTFKINS